MVSLALIYPMASEAEDTSIHADADAFSRDLKSVLTFGNDTTEVSIYQCVLQIRTQLRTICSSDFQPKWSHTTLVFSEIVELELKSFRGEFVMRVDLGIPLPSAPKTLLNRLIYGTDEAFERFVTESETLLENNPIKSNKSTAACSGMLSSTSRRSMSIFLESEPPSWSEFKSYVADCQ